MFYVIFPSKFFPLTWIFHITKKSCHFKLSLLFPILCYMYPLWSYVYLNLLTHSPRIGQAGCFWFFWYYRWKEKEYVNSKFFWKNYSVKVFLKANYTKEELLCQMRKIWNLIALWLLVLFYSSCCLASCPVSPSLLHIYAMDRYYSGSKCLLWNTHYSCFPVCH